MHDILKGHLIYLNQLISDPLTSQVSWGLRVLGPPPPSTTIPPKNLASKSLNRNDIKIRKKRRDPYYTQVRICQIFTTRQTKAAPAACFKDPHSEKKANPLGDFGMELMK
jgi:hypothetical protein